MKRDLIFISMNSGYYVIEDNSTWNMKRYLYYTKREAIMKYCEEYGIDTEELIVIDYTEEKRKEYMFYELTEEYEELIA